MSINVRAFSAVCGLLLAVAPACDDKQAQKADDKAQEIGDNIEDGAEKAGENIKEGAQEVGENVEGAVEEVEHEVAD